MISLGLRDEEFTLDDKPTILFLGDSFVWGLDSEADGLGPHWTPEGQEFVAQRMLDLFSASHIVHADAAEK